MLDEGPPPLGPANKFSELATAYDDPGEIFY
jgi:hypothetical protein